MSNRRVYYAVHSVAVAPNGSNVFTGVHGVQSVGITTRFNLENIFELSQLEIYELVENIPDVEITLEKVLDGYPPLYCLLTEGAASASLGGRSNQKAIIGLSIFSDLQDSASGTPLAQAYMSGVYCSSLNYNFPVQGNCTESVTVVGNNKVWNKSFTAPVFDNTDEPLAIVGSGGVNRRENVKFGASDPTSPTACILPQDIPGISASGTNELVPTGDQYSASIQGIRVSTNLGREQLFELGRRGPFHRYVTFPVEVTTEFEVLSKTGDGVKAEEENENNLTNRKIYLMLDEGLVLDLGSRNKLSNITYAGGNAGEQGGNVTDTYTYTNFNSLSVYHPQDPTESLRL